MRSVIYAGRMRERVTVQVAVESVNSLGEATLSYEDRETVWASVEGLSSSEVLGAGQQEIDATHRVRLRYLDGLTHKMRFRWRDRILEIVSLLEHGNRSQHEAICLEEVE